MVFSDLQSSFALVLALGGLALLVLPRLDRTDDRVRAVLFTIAAILGWRYMVWRITDTLPDPAFTADFIVSALFVALEALALVSSTLSFMVLSRYSSRTGEANANLTWWGDRAPQVDVLIATYNEEEAILARTIAGAAGMDHPALRVWVLDDGKRDWLRDLCEAKGVGYLRRPDNSHAKAGNINHALAHLSGLEVQPDFIAVLDADFVPHRDFVSRALALFHDPGVGLVQTPQHFFNPDPIQANLNINHAYPDEQRFFFDHVMASRDAWGIAFCCGTSSMIRWSGLQAIGGFPTDSVTEDFLVTLKLKAIGLRTVYLNERLSDGLAPEGLKEYITQRGRWCLGLVQIIRGQLGPFARNSLTFMDRVGLVDSFLYWAITFSFRLACFIAPPLYWFLGVTVVDATLPSVIAYFAPFFLAVMIALNWTTRGQVVPILTDVGQMLTMFEINKAVVTGLLKPKGHKFKVTAKGGERGQVTVQWGLLRRFGILFALNLGGMLYATIADYRVEGGAGDGKWIVLFWTFYNLAALALAMIVCVEQPRYRREERFQSQEEVRVAIPGRNDRNLRLLDISISGARIQGAVDLEINRPLTLHLSEVGAIKARLLARHDGFFSVAFQEDPVARDRMIRKLYADEYTGGTPTVRMTGIIAGLGERLFR